MIQLFLNGQAVYTQENTPIKLVKNNPLFTKSGSSTFNINIPMSTQNVKVIGHLNRIDLSVSPITFTAKLVVNNRALIAGEAVITEITRENVKVQILAGTSLMNFQNKAETVYIDELDLGIWPMEYLGNSVKSTYGMFYLIWTEYVYRKNKYNIRTAQEYLFDSLFGRNDWVAFPIYNETSEIMCNDWIFRHVVDEEEPDRDNVALEPIYSINGRYSEQGYPQVRFSIQPYLTTMIKKVFTALGYSVDISSLQHDKLFSKIFIATANEDIFCNSALPHWTVSEFIEQLENFYGLVITVEETEKKVSIFTRSDFCNSSVCEIKEIFDEFTISCDEDDVVALDKNIGYEEVDPFTRIDTSISQHAQHKYYQTFQELLNDREEVGAQAYYEKYKGYLIHVEQPKESFIVIAPDTDETDNPWIRRVDYFKNRGAADSDVTLKIVPVKCNYEYQVDSYINGNIWDGYFGYPDDRSIAFFYGGIHRMSKPDVPLRAWTEPISSVTNNTYITDIVAAINGEEDFTKDYKKDDLMRVAINAKICSRLKGMTLNHSYRTIYRFFPKPITYSWEKEYQYDYDYQEKQIPDIYGLNLCDGIPTTSIATELIGKGPKIKPNKKYCIKFITDEILNPKCRFLIHNQIYLCERLEYTTKDSGMDKVVTGYFYKLEE